MQGASRFEAECIPQLLGVNCSNAYTWTSAPIATIMKRHAHKEAVLADAGEAKSQRTLPSYC